ncbi:CDP-alcohol phosphatidyltransferase family protein [Paraflavitalea pollutisoli]|uniref:CDP-alcohol phosphatidyltransferase family protein n=1 Tax=Paraflavitalea pollutisoli TaxID=3034143 RepID=UPI0023ED5A36|nr:CDP-alcohol phosphatidyltransferase family protein [Paraflavitalea sp. H1-2-19X]
MNTLRYRIVNGITLYRLLSAPVLVAIAWQKNEELFKWLLALSFLTDMVDGRMARWLKVTSHWGAALDSLADDATVVAGLLGVILLKPAFFWSQLGFILPLLILLATQITMAIARYGKPSSFHTHLAKWAALLQGLSLILLFFLPQPPWWLFYGAIVVTALDLIEEIVLVILLPHWKTDVKGIYWLYRSPLNHRV